MSSQFPTGCKIYWREILAADDIRAWVTQQRMPNHLRGSLSEPGVYRFVFPVFTDGNGSHRSCYVGEAGKIGRRFRQHFKRDKEEVRDKSGQIVMRAGWRARGGIQNNIGQFLVQLLTIDGAVNFCDITLNAQSFDNPFERRLLENWAIRHSELHDHFHVLNLGVSQPTKNLFELLRVARKKHGLNE